MTIPLQAMLTFARVVEAGSLAEAARRMDVALPSVSKQIAQLERQIGAPLFMRRSRPLRLTDAGAACARHCAAMAEEVRRAREAVTRMQAAPQGRLRISGPPGLMADLLVPWLPEFRLRYPQIELDFSATQRMVDLAEEGYDLALRVTDRPPPQVVARRLADMRAAVCAAPGYLARHPAPHDPMDLLQHDCLQMTPPGLLSRAVFARGDTRLDVPLHGVLRFNQFEPLHLLARAGLGVALLPTHLLREDFASGRLVRLLPDWRCVVDAALYAIYLPDRYGQPKLRAFVDFLLEKFAPARRPRG